MNRTLRFALLTMIVVCVSGAYHAVAFSFVPSTVSAAYRGESSVAFFNELFDRQPARPLSLYISYAQTSLFWLGSLAVSIVIVWLTALDASWQRWWDKQFGPVAQDISLSSIPVWRRFTVIGAVVGLPFLSLIPNVLNIDLWPFSPYNMYSNSRPHEGPAVTLYRLYGVTPTEPVLEIEFPFGKPPNQTFEVATVIGAWSRLRGQDLKTHQAMAELLAQYSRRQHEQHASPPFEQLRLYREEWQDLSPDASNRSVPDRKSLLAEVSARAPHEEGSYRR
jgi:hypothetical protein